MYDLSSLPYSFMSYILSLLNKQINKQATGTQFLKQLIFVTFFFLFQKPCSSASSLLCIFSLLQCLLPPASHTHKLWSKDLQRERSGIKALMLLEYLHWELITIIAQFSKQQYVLEEEYILCVIELEEHNYEVKCKLLLNCIFVNY